MEKYKFTLLDVCCPDFFQGYSGPVLAVPVDGSTTKEELVDLIDTEYNSFDLDRLPELSDSELERMCDDFILTDEPFKGQLDPRPEEHDDCIKSCYMYFTVTKDEE
jgi:hypothetical protein